jgi:hypothetical protein
VCRQVLKTTIGGKVILELGSFEEATLLAMTQMNNAEAVLLFDAAKDLVRTWSLPNPDIVHPVHPSVLCESRSPCPPRPLCRIQSRLRALKMILSKRTTQNTSKKALAHVLVILITEPILARRTAPIQELLVRNPTCT